MNDIDQQREKLRIERQAYEEYFSSKKHQQSCKLHSELIGKCYIAKDNVHSKYAYLRAFKIVEVLDPPCENYAVCIALLDGFRNTCFLEYGIQKMTLNLWGSVESRHICNEADTKLIDCYSEITQKQFQSVQASYLRNLTQLNCI